MTTPANTQLELEAIKWDNITGQHILVEHLYDDMTAQWGVMTLYYFMTKKNDKSAWLVRCDADGVGLGIKAERFPRRKVPRRIVKGKLKPIYGLTLN